MNTRVRRRLRSLTVVITALATLLSCRTNDDSAAVPKTITDQILEDEQFSLLRTAVQHAGVGDALDEIVLADGGHAVLPWRGMGRGAAPGH